MDQATQMSTDSYPTEYEDLMTTNHCEDEMNGWGPPDSPWKNMNHFENNSFCNFSPSTQVSSESISERMPASGTSQRSRNFVFTLNNPMVNCEHTNFLITTPDYIIPPEAPFSIKFIIWQLEKGSNGTEHLQGYIQMASPQRLSTMRSMFNGKAHIEIAKGNKNSNILYCTKTDTRIAGPWIYPGLEDGETLEDIIEQAKKASKSKSDRKIDQMFKDVRNKVTEDTLIDRYGQTYLRNFSFINSYVMRITPPRNWIMDVIVLQGPTGCGKSKFVFDNYDNVFTKMDNRWWDGYDRHETVLLDDFYGGWIKFADFLKLLDRYPYQVEVKGGARQFVAKTILITTNAIPSTWYKYNFSRISRRVTTWKVWDENQECFVNYDDYAFALRNMKDYHNLELLS